MKKPAYLVLIALAALLLLLGVSHIIERIPEKPAETEPPESFTPAEGAVTYIDGLDRTAYPADSPEGRWLTGCEDSDRDEQWGAHILAHTAESGGTVTYTYLVYYRHGESSLVAAPVLHEGDSGSRRLDVTYTAGTGQEGYTLTHITVTHPAGEEPRVRLMDTEGEKVGSILTVTETAISLP